MFGHVICKLGHTHFFTLETTTGSMQRHLDDVNELMLKEERRLMDENRRIMIDDITYCFNWLVKIGGLSSTQLNSLFKTRLKPSVTVTQSRKLILDYLNIICPRWYSEQGILDIIDLANENVEENNPHHRETSVELANEIVEENNPHRRETSVGELANEIVEGMDPHRNGVSGRIDRFNCSLKDGEQSPQGIIQKMRRSFEKHQDRVNDFFTSRTVLYAEQDEGSNIAFICFDSENLDEKAKSEIHMRASQALFHDKHKEYIPVFLNLRDCRSKKYDIILEEDVQVQHKMKSSSGQDTARRNRPGLDQFVNKATSEHPVPASTAVEYPGPVICYECSQLANIMCGRVESNRHDGGIKTNPIPFLNQFPY